MEEGGSEEAPDHSQDTNDNFSNTSASNGSCRQDSLDSLDRHRKYFAPSLSLPTGHKFSFEISEFHSEDEQMRFEDFFDD